MAQDLLHGGTKTAQLSRRDHVVISGMSGKFPNSHNVAEFVSNLLAKQHLCDEDDRRGIFDHPEVPKLSGKLYDVDVFDAGFFGTHPRHARHIDPAGRIFLEQVAEAIFDAGLHPDDLRGTRTALFVGACASEYELMMYQLTTKDTHLTTGTARSMIAQRVAYWLQLNGPALICDTACSSGMYALEHGYRSIIEGRCDRAIIGASNLCLDQYMTLQFARLGVLNYGCGCRPFDEDASGYTRAEAIVAIILQRESEAKRVYAKIVHAKSNADGFKPQGITFPSFDGQLTVLKDVYEEAQMDPKKIGFIEAHGTGTKVGDPEELAVLDEFFKPTQEEPLLIGSVKGNIGHTEPVSGLCSIVKTLSMLNFDNIIPNIHFDKPRVGVKPLEEKRLQVVTEIMPYPSGKPCVGVNCFGFGGANSHVILEKNPKRKPNHRPFDPPRLVCYSGRTQEAIDTIHGHICTSTDVEYLQLLQEAFRKPYKSELYRGFTLVGSELHSNKLTTQPFQDKIVLVLGQFKDVKYLDTLKKIPLIGSVALEVQNILKSSNPSLVMQTTLVKVFKELNLAVEILGQDKVSLQLRGYYKNEVDFGTLLHTFASNGNNNNNSLCPEGRTLDSWIRKTAIYGKKATIVACGTNKPSVAKNLEGKTNMIHLDDTMTTEHFLYQIGRLYEEGFNPQVQKLYADLNFPVSCGTNMLSHLVQWKHKEIERLDWSKSTFFDLERRDFVHSANGESVFYRGHLIDNRNLFPATGYLWHIWNLFADLRDLHPNSVSVAFEDVRFHRAITLQDYVELYLVIQEDGNFELSSQEITTVTGRIYAYDENENPEPFIKEERKETSQDCRYVMTGKDAYKELRLRGYNYKGYFRAIHEVTPNGAIVKWDNNWVTFLDNMMQVCILGEDTRNLYVPVGIERLVIRAENHMKYVESLEDKLVPIEFEHSCNRVYSKFIEMRGLNARSITRRRERLQPVLETYQFVPNEYTTTLPASIRINVQILLECKPTMNFRVVELLPPGEEELVSSHICDVIEDLPLVLPDMTVVTPRENFEVPNIKVEASMTQDNLLYVCKSPGEAMLQQADKALIEDGFVLCVCDADSNMVFPNNMMVLTKHQVEDSKVVYLVRKQVPKETKPVFIDCSDSEELNWLSQVQDAMQKAPEVVVYAQNNYKSGILGFTNCMTKEPGSNDKVRCFFVQDTRTFDFNNLEVNDDEFKMQLAKRMTINVFKNGSWGTYRHLLLPSMASISAHHWYATAKTPGDLSSLTWMQGPLTVRNTEQFKPFKVAYSSLNFRDLMLATGKLSPEAITRNRFLQDRLQGFEFAGYDANGARFIGMAHGAIANYVDRVYYTLPVPDDWDLADAATVIVVYATVLWAMLKMANLKKHQSVLIHSGTGGIGLSALNVCSYFECDIFVTVGTQDKREFLLKNYPNLKPSHIGNSRNTSFKEMVMRETQGQGVDIVLNSLAEEKLQASVECLAHGGVFLEIGKYDLDKNSELFMDLASKECRYHGVMLDSLFLNATDELKVDMTNLLKTGLEKGYIKPLPKTVFQIDELEKAFKFMSTGKHIGKVLIKVEEAEEPKALPRLYCDPNCSYIIFGGLGGFGLELADWLVTRGAKNLILYSRKGITTGYQRYRVSLWKSYGVNVVISMEDVTEYDTCLRALKKVHATAPIDAIFNLAVVLKDAILEHQSIETMKTSIAPKALLTQYLDKISRELCPQLRYFVVFSSVSCGRGNGGQTNYGFSNSIMERICELRHADGLPALAVQWGAVGDVGLLEELQREHNEIAIGGTLQQKVANCLQVFDHLLQQDQPVASSIVVAEKFNKGTANTPIEAVVKILGVTDIKSVSPHTPFPELGMDSMMAVEIRQTLEREFDILLGPNDLRNLTFAKLEDMSAGYGKEKAGASVDSVMLTALIPGVILAKSKETLVDFNKKLSTGPGDFILVFPGVDADIRSYEKIADVINKHIKCISYDCITLNQENVDVIVDYVYDALHEEIIRANSFRIVAHSVGCFAAIELVKRFERANVTGNFILIDGAPSLMYQVFDIIKGKSESEFECNVIEALVSTALPTEPTIGLKELLAKGKDLNERVELLINHYSKPSQEVKEQLRALIFSFLSRVMSVKAYKIRQSEISEEDKPEKIKSSVILYKPSQTIVKDMADDYELNTICTLKKSSTFEGTHTSILQNSKLHEQLALDFYT